MSPQEKQTAIDTLLNGYESGELGRRDLVKRLLALGTLPVVASAGGAASAQEPPLGDSEREEIYSAILSQTVAITSSGGKKIIALGATQQSSPGAREKLILDDWPKGNKLPGSNFPTQNKAYNSARALKGNKLFPYDSDSISAYHLIKARLDWQCAHCAATTLQYIGRKMTDSEIEDFAKILWPERTDDELERLTALLKNQIAKHSNAQTPEGLQEIISEHDDY